MEIRPIQRTRRWPKAAVTLLLVLATAVLPGRAAGGAVFPDVIPLPNGWMPEGIAAGRGAIMYSGSRATGQILAVNVVTGQSRIVVDEPAGSPAVGLKLDRFGRLWVAGGNTGQGFVYDAETGDTVAVLQLAPAAPTFVNDVVVTRDAAWFTDSNQPVLYKVPIGRDGSIGEPVAVPLSGDYQHVAGFNLNGIAATPNERWLIVVQSSTGILYRVNPDTGEATRIDLGGATVRNGDGLLIQGRTLYVVQNRDNKVTVIRMDAATFASGEVVGTITSPNFDTPTTIAALGNRFYLVNARFTTPATPLTPYSMVAVRP